MDVASLRSQLRGTRNEFFPARGTIFTYGVDGVCHQLANQAHYATSTAACSKPLNKFLAKVA